MARPLRLHVPGGFYHVTLRGNHRQPIFFTETDRDLLDEIVAEVTAKLSSQVHAFCWMTNHVHLLLQVSDQPLGKVILRIASRYARTVQSRMATTGHLFERRYHGVLVDVDTYLLALVRYIHLNPVKAGLVGDVAAYRWSSHRDYLEEARRPWVTTGFVMKMLGTTHESACAAYRALMLGPCRSAAETDAFDPDSRRGRILGDDAFAARVTAPPPRARARWSSVDAIVVECCTRFACDASMLASRSKAPSLAAARAWVAHEAVSGGLASICAVARRLNRCESSIRELMARHPHKWNER